jgi:hypothetical protein
MARGGWRYGAGRPGHKGKAEACLRLDVREWARRRTLTPGNCGSWSWSNTLTGEHSGSISYRIENAAAILSYSLNNEPRSQRVPILRTSCNYGGTRPWFACPHCGARCAVIYLRRGGFYCRACAQVAYYSQSEDACGRAWRVQQKAEAKLGDGWARPKGMHRKTRERLLEIIWRCEERREVELALFMARWRHLL